MKGDVRASADTRLPCFSHQRDAQAMLPSIAISSELAAVLYQGKIKFQDFADSKVKED
ncbi:hypothetical protein BuS5_02073 [Desulfosarcina sp. BuS5]|uniref:hypothetical protein n=1 Tax=Desulfosarcina sp. BuS5 TaxID=933262 RepID=UPI0012F762B3|nr:hypothetical protein [Desulfosarcina sp. BuS5]WDN89105.1 hypothetical protein BuS5_02073 [Desulfosarcina sp. BuS5]